MCQRYLCVCFLLLLVPLVCEAGTSLLSLVDVLELLANDRLAAEKVLNALDADPSAGGFLPPEKRQRFLEALTAGKKNLPERFPVLTVSEMNQMMRNAGDLARKKKGKAPPPATADLVKESLNIPTGKPPQRPLAAPKELAPGLTRGFALDPERSKTFADSERLADVLNALALNHPDQPRRFVVTIDKEVVSSPAELTAALAKTGHRLVVRDVRYFANFGNLSYKGREVATPLWLDTGIPVPGEKRTLLVPATHSQHELVVTGPTVNAVTAFYFGTDGQAIFRPMPMKLQAWVGGRVAREYKGEQAHQAVRIAGVLRRVVQDKHQRYPDLPFNGYYALGVCNDFSALIELALTKKTTLFPLVRDLSFYPGQDEIDRLARQLPVDGGKEQADMERIFGSQAVDNLEQLPFPALRADLAKLRTGSGQ
jgi:hypothetical protein